MTSTPLPNPAARAAVALVRAEARREMLEYLADWGMSLSKDICTRSIDSPYHPELKHDPGRSFGAASRAVRLTLAMEERVETYILALCNGSVPAPEPVVADKAAGRPAAEPTTREAVEPEIGDGGETREGREREWEHLVEREDFEALLAGEPDAYIDVARAHLGAIATSLTHVREDDRPRREPEGGGLQIGAPAARACAGFSTQDDASHEEEGGPDTKPIVRSAGFQPALSSPNAGWKLALRT